MHRLKKFLTSLLPQPEYALNTITIHQERILRNLKKLQQHTHHQTIFPVLKANAYGHGLKQISTILKTTDVPYICVDSFPEYQIVKDYAAKKSLIMGETHPENYTYYDPRRATVVIYNTQTLQSLIATGKKRTIHLFINTGMNREGIQLDQLDEFFNLLQNAPQITLEGVMSHFANADEPDSSFNESQIHHFKNIYATIETLISKSAQKKIIYRHIANSAGIVKVDDPFFTATRSGIAMYGYNPLQPQDPHYSSFVGLEPALDIVSTIVAIQHVKQGDIVSYGGKWTADTDTTLITVPFGYYEGLTRRLTNNRHYTRNNHALDQVGTICMNISSCNAGTYHVQLGDTITIISSTPDAPNTIHAFAEKTGTIPYEVLVNLNEKIRRVIL